MFRVPCSEFRVPSFRSSLQSASTAYCLLFTIHYSLFTIHYLLFTVHCSPKNYLLFAVRYSLLFTVYCLLFTPAYAKALAGRIRYSLIATLLCILLTAYCLLPPRHRTVPLPGPRTLPLTRKGRSGIRLLQPHGFRHAEVGNEGEEVRGGRLAVGSRL